MVVVGVVVGKPFDDSVYRGWLLFSTGSTLSIILPVYAAVVSILPVWVLLCPRGYLSSYMKVGVIVLLAVGILVAHPTLRMPALTPFIHGGGPIAGTVWPFVCIVIACGALSGFHALIASGTTPKMINKETDIRVVGYGAMLMEGVVSLTALIAACALEPGDYFKINTEPRQYAELVDEGASGIPLGPAPHEIQSFEGNGGHEGRSVGRAGGAVTLAIGMAKVFSDVPAAGGGTSGGAARPGYLDDDHGLPLSLRHHVRGAVHSHVVGDGHPRGEVHPPRDAVAVQRPAGRRA